MGNLLFTCRKKIGNTMTFIPSFSLNQEIFSETNLARYENYLVGLYSLSMWVRETWYPTFDIVLPLMWVTPHRIHWPVVYDVHCLEYLMCLTLYQHLYSHLQPTLLTLPRSEWTLQWYLQPHNCLYPLHLARNRNNTVRHFSI